MPKYRVTFVQSTCSVYEVDAPDTKLAVQFATENREHEEPCSEWENPAEFHEVERVPELDGRGAE